MTNSMPDIRPGDVISSDLMKFILEKLSEIDGRVTTLESGGSAVTQVTIASFEPPTQIPAGQELTINGTNFAFPPSLNTVTIDGVAVSEFRPGSTSTRLRLIVPTTLSIPAGGRNVIVRVANTQGEFSALYRVMPAVAAPGNPPVIESILPAAGPNLNVNQAAIITGQNFANDPTQNIITFEISTTGVTTTYPQPGQSIEIDAANSSTTQISLTLPDIVEIPSGQTRPVTVRVGVGAHVPASVSVAIRRPLVV